jgi:hypothetical protein
MTRESGRGFARDEQPMEVDQGGYENGPPPRHFGVGRGGRRGGGPGSYENTGFQQYRGGNAPPERQSYPGQEAAPTSRPPFHPAGRGRPYIQDRPGKMRGWADDGEQQDNNYHQPMDCEDDQVGLSMSL